MKYECHKRVVIITLTFVSSQIFLLLCLTLSLKSIVISFIFIVECLLKLRYIFSTEKSKLILYFLIFELLTHLLNRWKIFIQTSFKNFFEFISQTLSHFFLFSFYFENFTKWYILIWKTTIVFYQRLGLRFLLRTMLRFSRCLQRNGEYC